MAHRYLLSGLLMILAVLAPSWIAAIQLPVFILLVGSVGMLHGALDHHVAFRYYGMRTDTDGWVKFLGGYLGVMVLYGIVWYVFPAVALAIFMAMSLWHFGQSDMHGYRIRSGEVMLSLTRSGAVLGVMFGMHIDGVQQIIAGVVPLQFPSEVGYAIAAGSLIAHLAVLLRFRPRPLKMALVDIMWLAAMSVLLPLLLAFAVYFALWHSVDHLRELQSYLHYSRWTQVVRNGLPFTVVAVLMVLAFTFVLPRGENPMDWVLFLFIAVSLLTMPHMLLVDKMMRG